MRKIAIVAKAATAALAPFDDESWDIWGLAWVAYPRATRLFDIHSKDFKKDTPTDYNSQRNKEYIENCRKRHGNAPVFSLPGSEFHNRADYPLDEVFEILPRVYLECTVSYMLALVALEHKKYGDIERVGLWGCHFTGRHEYQWQRPSVTWLVGLLEGMGVKVDICPGSPLLLSCYTQGRYGIDRGIRDIA